MTIPLFCQWKEKYPQEFIKNRQGAIARLQIDSEKSIPVFDEATQITANSVGVSICCLGIILGEEYIIKSAYGLSNLGVMNELATSRKISSLDAFATNVIDSGKSLIISDTEKDPFFRHSLLSCQYGIKSYVGVPLITSDGNCIGCLEILSDTPLVFQDWQTNFMAITARWCMAEYERNYLINSQVIDTTSPQSFRKAKEEKNTSLSKEKISTVGDNLEDEFSAIYIQELIFRLLNHLSNKLSIPLTSVVGMSSVLKQKIYGELNIKQSEYLDIIYHSGQEMTILVEEITQLSNLKGELELDFVPVDLENLGQQVIQTLTTYAQQKEHSLRLSIEPGEKIWNLDRDKIKKTLFYLIVTLIEGSRSGGEININISKRENILRINCRVYHPWLGDGISLEKVSLYREILNEKKYRSQIVSTGNSSEIIHNEKIFSYDIISLLFSAYLARLQGGNILLSGSVESGHRFIICIPIKESEVL